MITTIVHSASKVTLLFIPAEINTLLTATITQLLTNLFSSFQLLNMRQEYPIITEWDFYA